jgi:hypothetical protein
MALEKIKDFFEKFLTRKSEIKARFLAGASHDFTRHTGYHGLT